MDNETWMDAKYQQIELYVKRANTHHRKNTVLMLLSVLCGIVPGGTLVYWLTGMYHYLPDYYKPGFYFVLLGLQVLWFVAFLIWRLSTYEDRSAQLLTQLAVAISNKLASPYVFTRKEVTEVETRFLSNDDELFMKKELWDYFMWDEEKLRDIGYISEVSDFKVIRTHVQERLQTHPPWLMSDIAHRQGYEDSNTIEDEWAIIKTLRHLFWADKWWTWRILQEASKVARENPVVFERFLRKEKVSKKLNEYRRHCEVNYLSPAAKMRLVTFVESVLALSPNDLNEKTVTLLHEKNQQIQKYTDEFWRVHKRSIKFYWFEALWLLLLIPFIVAAVELIGRGAEIEGLLVATFGAALVAFGEMALIVRQKIKLNGKKLIPPLIASLIGSRHSMCTDTESAMGIDHHRRRFKNLEKHFIMTTPEIDSVKYVKDNLRDEERTSKLHEADEICEDAQRRMDTYYKMFHLYRRKCLQYGAFELFMAIMILPIWGFFALGVGQQLGFPILDLIAIFGITLIVLSFIVIAARRHIKVWRFKEMYFKIYQGLSVLIVDGDLRQDPEKLNSMFRDIEQSALNAINDDPAMTLMVGTLSRVSGLDPVSTSHRHRLDEAVAQIRASKDA